MSMNWPPLADSLWAATARPAPATPPLNGDIETDVAVVGFSGRGVPTATAMGRDIAQMIVEDSPNAMAPPITQLPRNPLGPVREFVWHNIYLPFHRTLDRA